MKIVLVHSGKAFLPEVDAYQRHLESKGHAVMVQTVEEAAGQVEQPDLYYRFAGFLRHRLSPDVPEIHEYASASVGAFPRVKNLFKSVASARPVGRVFLNAFVKDQFHFPVSAPFLFRDMGADQAFFDIRGSNNKRYDLVYAGAISTRPGLLQCISALAHKGFRIGLAGSMSEEERLFVAACPGVEYVGRLPLKEVPGFIAQSHAGLNFCPDIYPYNIQTSTKVIEYLAAGISVVSNQYAWIDDHAARFGYDYINVATLGSPADLVGLPRCILDVAAARQFEWGRLLDNAGFEPFVRQCMQSDNRDMS